MGVVISDQPRPPSSSRVVLDTPRKAWRGQRDPPAVDARRTPPWRQPQIVRWRAAWRTGAAAARKKRRGERVKAINA